jgi:hypothetical protein
MLELLLANQEKAEAERKADREALNGINAKMDANQAKAAKQEEMLAEMSGTMHTDLNEMREEIKSGQAKMRSIIFIFRSELKETIQREMRASIQSVRSEFYETTTCREATETEPGPGMMQPIEKHLEIPKEEAAVMPVGEPRKRRRVCNLAAERRQKMRQRTRGKSWIQEEVGCRLQEDAPARKSGMAKKKLHQENSDPGKSWITEEIGRCTQRGYTVQKWHCYSYSEIKSVMINCNSAWRIPNKTSVKSRTHKLYVALTGKHTTIYRNPRRIVVPRSIDNCQCAHALTPFTSSVTTASHCGSAVVQFYQCSLCVVTF